MENPRVGPRTIISDNVIKRLIVQYACRNRYKAVIHLFTYVLLTIVPRL